MCVVLLLTLAALPTFAGAQSLTWTPANTQLIEDNAGYYGYNPQVAISGSNVVAIWYQSNGGAYRIYSNYAAFPEEEDTGGGGGSVAVGPLAVGMSAFLVWRKRRKQR